MKVFLLTEDWFDRSNKNYLEFYGLSENQQPVLLSIKNNQPLFFVGRSTNLSFLNMPYSRKQIELKSFDGTDVDAVYFDSMKDLLSSDNVLYRKNIATYEADVNPGSRYLMERFIFSEMEVEGKSQIINGILTFTNPKIKPAIFNPEFKILSLDIETNKEFSEIYSIACHITGTSEEIKKVFIIGNAVSSSEEYIIYQKSEKELLKEFIIWFMEVDPDILIGWHVVGFDLAVIQQRFSAHGLKLNLGRGNKEVKLRESTRGRYFASVTGRIIMDGPTVLRNSFYSFEDYRLETVAQELLGKGKLIVEDENKTEEITTLFNTNKEKLAEYNLNDAILVSEIFRLTGLIELSVRRSQISGLRMDKLGFMTQAFDFFYLPRLHRSGFVAPNRRDIGEISHSAGGYVIEPNPGIYENINLFDFKSLYPSIIRTFKIDPLSRIKSNINPLKTPTGYQFSGTEHILPDYISTLLEKREKAAEKDDQYLSQAIKILMNSFYGVMGANNCRFYHPDLPSAITSIGQWILLQCREYFHNLNKEVIYGDTDSLFIQQKGSNEEPDKIAKDLNKFLSIKLMSEFGINSYLHIKHEKFYKKFIITSQRGGEAGAKKRYVGLINRDGEEIIEFVGMEFVRSDWTPLAKEFQMELYKKAFSDQPLEEMILSYVKHINNGDFDNKLIYRKRVRRELKSYKINVPPHVKAARMLDKDVNVIEYVMTHSGPVPIQLNPSGIDYNHYITKQIKPVADSLLSLFGMSFDEIVKSDQLNLFN